MSTKQTAAEALADFAKSLPRAGSPLQICPPGCAHRHDKGKVAGRDHWVKTATRRRKTAAEAFSRYGDDADEARFYLA